MRRVVSGILIFAFACSPSADRELTRVDGGAGDSGTPAIVANDASPHPTGGAEVFGHSDTALYRLDPETKAVTVVGNFDGCYDIIDIALDEDSNMYGASETALFLIDRFTAKCTLLKEGSAYPNSLSFVPKGTVDPNKEALVGFVDHVYYRIDPVTGAKTSIGTMGPDYRSSGDIVSVKGGKTYVTVLGNTCHDCLAEINPVNGSIVHLFGSLGYEDVFGLTFWGGSAYGFTNGGALFEIHFVGTGNTATVGTTAIPIAGAPSGLRFWGAGSTTSAPLEIR